MAQHAQRAQHAKQLAFLVGSNPLPNYIVARMLEPRKIRGYCSAQTRMVGERLREALVRDLGLSQQDFELIELSDPNDMRKLANEVSDLQGWHLDYTGGTKTMSAFFYHFFRSKCDPHDTASYLDDHDPAHARLRFDDGDSRDIDVKIEMKTLALLHGLKEKGSDRQQTTSTENPPAFLPNRETVLRLASEVFNDHEIENLGKCEEGHGPVALLDKLYRTFHWDRKKPPVLDQAIDEAWIPIPGLVQKWPGFTMGCKEKWARFLSGTWLEDYVKYLLLPMPGIHFLETSMKYSFHDGKDEVCELDVAIIRQHRLYVISCTTDATTGICKSKAFEILHRARQLGGDLARAALVCCMPDHKARSEIQGRIKKNWNSPTEIEVWGRDSLTDWLANAEAGTVPRPLQNWLTK